MKKVILSMVGALSTALKKTGIEFNIVDKVNYTSYHKRPKRTGNVKENVHIRTIKKIALLLQGPIVYKDNFTLETIKLYKRLYPYCTIILSTWNDVTEEEVKKYEELGVEVILSEIPEVIMGCGTINLQLINTYAGVCRAKELECEYVCKTRTDQRMYASDVMEYCLKLMELFPVNFSSQAKYRIVACGMNTFRKRLYAISDMWMFGYIDDMMRYWSCPQDERVGDDYKWVEKQKLYVTNVEEYSKFRFCEIWLCSHYIEACGHNLEWTLPNSLFYEASLFIIIDKQSLDLYWWKYGEQEYRWLKYDDDLFEELSFKEWLLMQKNDEGKI